MRGTPRWRRSQVRTDWRHGSAGGGPEKRDGGPGATTAGSSGLGPAAFTARGRQSVMNQHARLPEGTRDGQVLEPGLPLEGTLHSADTG